MAAKKSSKKKSAAKKKTAAKAGAKKVAPKKAAPKKAAAKKSAASSSVVMMGHVFSLRPRVTTAFKPDDFRRARQLLEDESFQNLQEAARAVAEKALELTQGGPEGVRKPKRY